jgi:hypothetical protein
VYKSSYNQKKRVYVVLDDLLLQWV